MAVSDTARIDPGAIAALHVEHADQLRNFILGVLRDPDLTSEVIQAAFTKAIEQGHKVAKESLKAWLFRVAYNEAMLIRRRQAVGQKAVRRLAENGQKLQPPPELGVCRHETVAAVREALNRLPAEQGQVVRMRIYDQKKFAQIAEELALPLGTVLSRMQLALKKLKGKLDGFQD